MSELKKQEKESIIRKVLPDPEIEEVDPRKFEALSSQQNPKEVIASTLGVSTETLEQFCRREYGMTFHLAWKNSADRGRAVLLRKMWEQAMSGDRQMLIWLSKQYLGHTDKKQEQAKKESSGKIQTITIGDKVISFK